MSDCDDARRAEHRATTVELLRRLGSQDFAGACALLAEDVVCDWPFPPTPQSPRELRGRATMEAFFAGGMSAFEPYRYEVTRIFDLVDPRCVIAEYRSNSRLRKSGAPYRNQYLGIFAFRDGRVAHWREYIDPTVVAQVLATLGERT